MSRLNFIRRFSAPLAVAAGRSPLARAHLRRQAARPSLPSGGHLLRRPRADRHDWSGATDQPRAACLAVTVV